MISRFGALPSAPLVLHCTAPLLLHSSALLRLRPPPPFFFHTSASFRAPYAHTQAGSCSRTRTAIHSLTPRRAHTCIYSTHGQSCSSWQLSKIKKKKKKCYICFHQFARIEMTTQARWSCTTLSIDPITSNMDHFGVEIAHTCPRAHARATLGSH